MNKIVIGFAGHIHSGKDIAAKYLEEKLGFEHYKIAYPLQDIVAIVSGIYQSDLSHRLYFEDKQWKESFPLMKNNEYKSLSPRDLMKYIGTDLLREQLKDTIWSDILKVKLSKLKDITINIVISDVRYPEELDVIKNTPSWDGYLVYIVNPLAKELADTSHSSEQYQDYLKDNADYKIYNNPILNSVDSFKSSLLQLTEDILNLT